MSTTNNLTNSSTWKRILYMLLFAFTYSIAEFVIIGIAIVNTVFKLFTGDINENLSALGKQSSLYVYDILLFLTYNTEKKPFPFSAWPNKDPKTLS
ncbi:MAG: DUF4389 domain-containing protein [Thiotrichaceae bacterium]|nr:DUF4389 domain-containing protein [Thiotrichaceae bacterium]